jgi:hypothetical protein
MDNKPLEELTVFTFEHIDDMHSFNKVENMPLPPEEKTALLEQLTEAFQKAGWKGDGEIGYCWIPPFFYNAAPNKDPGQIYGVEIYCVKQHDNGTAFIAVEPEGLPFISKTSLLARQNPRFFGLKDF